MGAVAQFFSTEKAPYFVTLFVAALAWTGLRSSERVTNTPFIEYDISRVTYSAPPAPKRPALSVESAAAAASSRDKPTAKNARPKSLGASAAVTSQAIKPADPAASSTGAVLAGTGFVAVQGAEVRMRNITTSHVFDCFLVTLIPPGAGFEFGHSSGQQHLFRGQVAALTTVTLPREDIWVVQVKDAMPGTDFTLRVPIAKGDGLPHAMVSPCSEGDGVSKAGEKKSPTPILMSKSAITRYVEYELYVLWVGLVVWFLLIV